MSAATPREQQPGIQWGTVLLAGDVLRAYRDNANGTIAYLKPPANYQTAAYPLARTFRADGDADARVQR